MKRGGHNFNVWGLWGCGEYPPVHAGARAVGLFLFSVSGFHLKPPLGKRGFCCLKII